MNKQLVFDKVSKHLLTQNKRCESETPFNVSCKYRKGDLKCAIGALIDDEEYIPVMDNLRLLREEYGCTANTVVQSNPLVLSIIKRKYGEFVENDIFFLKSLQKIHDVSDVNEWKVNLLSLAQQYGLRTNVLNNLEEVTESKTRIFLAQYE